MNDNGYHSDYEYHYKYGDSPGPGPASPGPQPGRRMPQYNDIWSGIAWVVDVVAIPVTGVFGLALTVAKVMGYDVVGYILRSIWGSNGSASAEKTASVHGGTSTSARKSGDTQKKSAQEKQTAAAEKEPQKTQASARKIFHADAGSTVKTVFGWILIGFGALGLLTSAAAAVTMWKLLTYVATAIGGGVLLFSSFAGRKKEAKFRRCLTITGEQGIVDIGKLVKTTGLNPAEADRILTEMIDRGFYGDSAYIDHERGLLVVRPEEMRDVYRREDEEKAARKAQTAEKDFTDYESYVNQLAHADELIEDESMSEKIRRMQSYTRAIFQEVEAHPEKRSQISRFLNYYLPTTLKLLDSYARIEAQGVTGENTAKAKADIERIADTLVDGYKKQLDNLYQREAMDIAGDVGVIENMLKRDGLSGQSDFGHVMGGH